MALWPFRRKTRRKRSRGNPLEPEEPRGRAADPAPPARSQTEPDTAMRDAPPAPQKELKRQRTEPNKLQRRPRAYSFSPGRHDSIKINRKMSRQEAIPPLPKGTGASQTGGFPAERVDSGMSVLKDDDLHRIPTLHNKRDGDHLPRKKSSKKRRKDDQEREAEIKAMSNFMPHRPATEEWTVGRPMKKDSKRVKNGFNLGFRSSTRHDWEKHNRSSEVSLPFPASIHSSLTSDSEHISYKISALEALAPRPTLRCTTHPRWSAGGGGEAAEGPIRRPSQRRKLSAAIPEATLNAHKRILDLADELDASDLRELMERDQRRRERKRQRDQEKLERHLARRAEMQRAAEAQAAREGRESPPNLERGVFGREAGLGIDPASAVVTSSKRRPSDDLPKQLGKRPEEGDGESMQDTARQRPLEAFYRTNSVLVPGTSQSPPEEAEEAVPPLVPSPKARSSRNFLMSKKSRSKSPPESEVKTEVSEPLQKVSETSSSRGPLSWTSIFRWPLKNRRNSGGPSSFSNTSRDSMQTTQLPTPTPPLTSVPRRVGAGVPKRTMSRFREDLPELPMSPPDSRIQSPEADPIPPTITEASPDLDNNNTDRDTEGISFAPPAQALRYDTPTSGHRSIEAMRQTPSTFSRPEDQDPSPEPQTMSLASIDSEGSWLSGRLGRRATSSILQPASRYLQHHRHASGSDNEQSPEHDVANEEASIAEDDYLSRVAHSNIDRSGWNRKSTGEARPSSDEEEEPRWGSIHGHHPTVVEGHMANRMKSREGLLNSFGEEGESDPGADHQAHGLTAELVGDSDDGGGDGEEEGAGVQRAKSVNLGKGHVRHISAGSARLLSISPRASVDAKRRSLSPRP
ncbi:hypothetical protein QBC46DRAFT_39367 [Diplogelasinospora grovesii]|uniref:Uncharacterized protein n=1 Tax=Diplogelasinospora grovesii TaxID=303347 RepID=A0AAN6S7I5_9PEZI|nr:hypothetical protein QBC46DRAFT_39367 [Diplogelasinospora grovesii]